MHDVADDLRPKANAGALPPACNGHPNFARGNPLPPLRDGWSETIGLDVTVNAATEEGVTSRVIHGPFRIDEIAFRSSGGGTTSQQLRFIVGNLQPAPQAVLDGGLGLPSTLGSDSARTVAVFFATNVYERHPMRQIFRDGCARIAMILNNTTAGAISIVAQITLTHLVPATDPRETPLP
jgi:hypothetical protein